MTPLTDDEKAEAIERVKARDAEEEAALKLTKALTSISTSGELKDEKERENSKIVVKETVAAINEKTRETIEDENEKTGKLQKMRSLESAKEHEKGEYLKITQQNRLEYLNNENRLETFKTGNFIKQTKNSDFYTNGNLLKESNRKYSLAVKTHQENKNSSKIFSGEKFNNLQKQSTKSNKQTNQSNKSVKNNLNLHNWLIKKKNEFDSSDENSINESTEDKKGDKSKDLITEDLLSKNPNFSDTEFRSPENRKNSINSNKKLKTW